MSRKIIGVTVGSPLPKPNLDQTDPKKGDYVYGDRSFMKGEKGDTGATGKDGTSATHSWNGTVLTITSASGTSSADLKGEKGDTGATGASGKDGADGKTPVKGTDYFTDADKTEMVNAVLTALPVWTGGSY